MPFTEFEKLGPLQPLVGTWEGEGGVDVSFHHEEGETGTTAYRERVTFSPFGPVDNGTQCLYGLDYRMAAWRDDEEDPFHTEIGYWLWDAATGEIMRCFSIPRGIVVIAGGTAAADATSFTLKAANGDGQYAIGEGSYLHAHASSVTYEVTVTVGDGEWSYEEMSMLKMDEFPDLFPHSDRCSLTRIA